jgi:DNA-binding transcriptional LysR family regulator
MELRHLRYYVAVAEELSFGRAASRLEIAQPPLSRQIRALEDEVGVALLVRTKRRVLLTDAGRSFLEGARVALSQAARAVEQARRASRGEHASLSIAFSPIAELALMQPIVRAVGRAQRDVRLDVHTCSELDALRAVHAGTLHAAITPRPLSVDRDVRVDALVTRQVRAVVPAGHASARRQRIGLAQLLEESIVFVPRAVAPALHDAVASAFRAVGLALRVQHETSHLHTCLELVAAGLGVTFLPAVAGREAVVSRTLDPAPAPLDFVFAYREDLSPAPLREVLRIARAAVRTPA